ncbi:MAG: hypothetical protein NTU76_04225, partial [Candidatus Taylorbacteria bacterium]|nr:hypothetical protein [Candidatus Taylorbacteria bacterium]
KEGGVLLEQSGGVNVISFLSDNLVNLKYIPIIPQYGDVSEYVPYTYYSGKSNVATRDGANIYCGDQKINDYIFIFKNENLNLILPKMSSRNDTISGYCIGQ